MPYHGAFCISMVLAESALPEVMLMADCSSANECTTITDCAGETVDDDCQSD